MFFIAGNTQKLIGQETRKINKSGFLVNAEIKVYRNYIMLLPKNRTTFLEDLRYNY